MTALHDSSVPLISGWWLRNYVRWIYHHLSWTVTIRARGTAPCCWVRLIWRSLQIAYVEVAPLHSPVTQRRGVNKEADFLKILYGRCWLKLVNMSHTNEWWWEFRTCSEILFAHRWTIYMSGLCQLFVLKNKTDDDNEMVMFSLHTHRRNQVTTAFSQDWATGTRGFIPPLTVNRGEQLLQQHFDIFESYK